MAADFTALNDMWISCGEHIKFPVNFISEYNRLFTGNRSEGGITFFDSKCIKPVELFSKDWFGLMKSRSFFVYVYDKNAAIDTVTFIRKYIDPYFLPDPDHLVQDGDEFFIITPKITGDLKVYHIEKVDKVLKQLKSDLSDIYSLMSYKK